MSSSTTSNYFLVPIPVLISIPDSFPIRSTDHYLTLSYPSLSFTLIGLGALSRQQRMAVKLRASEKR